MNLPSPSYPGQILLGMSRLEYRALCKALQLALGLHFFGQAVYHQRSARDALRRIQRKLKRAAADTPS